MWNSFEGKVDGARCHDGLSPKAKGRRLVFQKIKGSGDRAPFAHHDAPGILRGDLELLL